MLVRILIPSKLATTSGVHRTEGLSTLGQVLREPVKCGSSRCPGVWWGKDQTHLSLGHMGEERRAADVALKLDRRQHGARQMLESL